MDPIQIAEEHQWIRVPSDNKQTIVCCDCGLAHGFEFRIRNEDGYTFVEWRSHRKEPLTAEIRHQENIVITK